PRGPLRSSGRGVAPGRRGRLSEQRLATSAARHVRPPGQLPRAERPAILGSCTGRAVAQRGDGRVSSVEEVAAAVLYEGYILWPYRRSARKNQQRWTFGGVYPPTFSDQGDASRMQTQCLVLGDDPRVDVCVRFLQVVDRRVARRKPDGSLEEVDELRAGGQRYLAWDEARER